MNSIEKLKQKLQDDEIKHVHAGIFDHDAVFREKRLPVEQFLSSLDDGWSFINALPWWGPNDCVRSEQAWNSEACQFDINSYRPYPFEDNAGLIIADYSSDNRALSPRATLQDLLKQANEIGINAVGASEFEFIILDQSSYELDATGYQTLSELGSENRCWSGSFPASDADLFAEYEDMLIQSQIPPHHLCSELGPGCVEVALPASPLLDAADQAALLKLYTRAFFSRRQQTASFMAQLSENHPGLGGHPIMSLTSVDSDKPLLVDADSPSGLSVSGEHFLAGILNLTPALTAMFASNVNSYRRYAPGNWAPRTATWGTGNYTCGVRIVNKPAHAARIEFRLPGADMNPFSAFAMLLGSGLHGLKNKLKLVPETQTIGRNHVHDEIGCLPRNLYEAADFLNCSAEARAIFGDAFIDHHVACCIHEADTMGQIVSPQERQRYLFHV